MHKPAYALSIALLFPAISCASTSANLESISCSGTFSSVVADMISLRCSGNLTLGGGSLVSDGKVIVSAEGDLPFNGVSITASFVELHSGHNMALPIDIQVLVGGQLMLGTPSPIRDLPETNTPAKGQFVPGLPRSWLTYQIDPIVRNPTGQVLMKKEGYILPAAQPGGYQPIVASFSEFTVLSAVPEPETYAMLLSGLGLFVAMGRRRHP